jgi:diguanylate cyclase (GGDEF)-like protein
MNERLFSRQYGENALRWFQGHIRQFLVITIEGQFPGWALPREIQEILRGTDAIVRAVGAMPGDQMPLADLLQKLSREDQLLFKRIMLLYRRHRAVETERLTEKTFHLELTATLEEEKNALDELILLECFVQIGELRLPRLKDFLPVQYIEKYASSGTVFAERQYDEKFHILQAPQLFPLDIAFFRHKCEGREVPLSIAFVDIDDFKSLNRTHTETKVDRNLLPRFMQAIEAHVFHHGYAYRQGGDEYLILLPSMSRSLAIQFLDELRLKLAELSYPEIPEKTTVSIGLCIAESDCPLTDRELLGRANQAKDFAKRSGKNRVATFRGPRLLKDEIEVVSGPKSST